MSQYCGSCGHRKHTVECKALDVIAGRPAPCACGADLSLYSYSDPETRVHE